jgi:hypothetical protein
MSFTVFHTLIPVMRIGLRYTRHKARGRFHGTKVSVHLDATFGSGWAVRFFSNLGTLGGALRTPIEKDYGRKYEQNKA